ncbi:MAG: hypothetical protein J6K73_04930 [Clostridia bacterium]|nr:hypothetical protein [Clostridia bacterium]
MNYALIDNNVVVNVIWLDPSNAYEFPEAVPLNDVPAGIGDTYDGEHFYRAGERVLTPAEAAYQELAEAQTAYREGVQEA